jgi:hypothetical protein
MLLAMTVVCFTPLKWKITVLPTMASIQVMWRCHALFALVSAAPMRFATIMGHVRQLERMCKTLYVTAMMAGPGSVVQRI